LAWSVTGGLVLGVASMAVPYFHVGARPNIADLLVGWTLIGSGLALGERRPGTSAWLLVASGVAWFVVDFDVLLQGWTRRALEGTSQMYLAVLAHAVLALPTERRHPRLTRIAAALVYAVAVVAGIGYFRVGLVIAGAAIFVATLDHWMIAGRRSDTASIAALLAGLVLGGGVLATAVIRISSSSPTASVLTRSVQLVIVTTSVLAFVAGSRQFDRAAGIDLASTVAGALGADVGRALGRTAVPLWFPTSDGGWIDPAGERARPHPQDVQLVRDRGVVLAAVSAPGVGLSVVSPALRELLRLSGEQARLQVAVRSRLDELAESRRRLLDAADAERRQLEAQLRNGALTRLATVQSLLTETGELELLRARASTTGRELEAIARGIDPLASGDLETILVELAHRSQPEATVRVIATKPPIQVARAIWYTCAEALTNVAKHAPGSTVAITVNETSTNVTTTIVDDGPGGADPNGSGLRGLADRAAALGGALAVASGVGGTTIVLRLPTVGPWPHSKRSNLTIATPTSERPATSR
jgi:signal transduction histidine kinase